MAAKLKKGDTVIVIAGKSKGEIGTILRVIDFAYPEKKRYVVEGVNLVKKAVRPNPQLNIEGGIKTMEAPIHHSNVAIYNKQTQKADRVGFKILEDGAKVRIYKSTGEQVVNSDK